jgi:hypothetical protein
MALTGLTRTSPTPDAGNNRVLYAVPAGAAASIASGASTSGQYDLGAGRVLIGLVIPSSWTSAKVTFLASADGVTFGSVQTVAGEVATATLAGGESVALDPATFKGIRFIQLRSGTSGSAVNQGADRIVTLVLRVEP